MTKKIVTHTAITNADGSITTVSRTVGNPASYHVTTLGAADWRLVIGLSRNARFATVTVTLDGVAVK